MTVPWAASASTDLAVGRHQTEVIRPKRAKALRDRVGLHVAVVVLAGPDKAAVPFHRAGDHVVDQAVFVGDAGLFELVLEFGLVDLLEKFHEAAIVLLEDGVLGREIDRPAQVEAVIQRARAKSRIDLSRLYIAMATPAPGASKTSRSISVPSSPTNLIVSLPGPGKFEVGGAVLVAEGVAADDDRLGPARDKPRHVLADDRFAEDDAAKDVADRAIGRCATSA